MCPSYQLINQQMQDLYYNALANMGYLVNTIVCMYIAERPHICMLLWFNMNICLE